MDFGVCLALAVVDVVTSLLTSIIAFEDSFKLYRNQNSLSDSTQLDR